MCIRGHLNDWNKPLNINADPLLIFFVLVVCTVIRKFSVLSKQTAPDFESGCNNLIFPDFGRIIKKVYLVVHVLTKNSYLLAEPWTLYF